MTGFSFTRSLTALALVGAIAIPAAAPAMAQRYDHRGYDHRGYDHRGGGWHGGGWRGGDNSGGIIGGALLGLVDGGVIGGALAAPPPADYAPPPVYYAPPPAAYYAPPQPRNCQTFNGDASIDASGAPFYGTACLQADGRWHIVN